MTSSYFLIFYVLYIVGLFLLYRFIQRKLKLKAEARKAHQEQIVNQVSDYVKRGDK